MKSITCFILMQHVDAAPCSLTQCTNLCAPMATQLGKVPTNAPKSKGQKLAECHGAASACHPAELTEITPARAGPTRVTHTTLKCPTCVSSD